jgi:hypothetical protein
MLGNWMLNERSALEKRQNRYCFDQLAHTGEERIGRLAVKSGPILRIPGFPQLRSYRQTCNTTIVDIAYFLYYSNCYREINSHGKRPQYRRSNRSNQRTDDLPPPSRSEKSLRLGHDADDPYTPSRHVTVLHILPVVSAALGVKAAILTRVKK